MRTCAFLLLAVSLVVPFAGTAQARAADIPLDDSTILESLPVGPRPIATGNASLPTALLAARAQLDSAHQLGDPRYLGYAEARLAPWLKLPEPPTEVLLLRARLLQANHRFDAAQADLARVLMRSPGHAEALLLSASIHQVRGRYPEARQACSGLKGLELLPLALICQAQVDGVTGHARAALTRLQKLPRRTLGLTPAQAAWLDLSLADLADRLGEDALAEAALKRALPSGAEAVGMYADWLQAEGRGSESLGLLRAWTAHDGLLMRLARAEQATQAEAFQQHRDELLRRLAAFRQRGEVGHEREQAMLYLDVLQDPGKALVLARRNWQQQRETADLRIYARAAIAARADADLALLRAWQSQTGFEDRRSEGWLRRSSAP